MIALSSRTAATPRRLRFTRSRAIWLASLLVGLVAAAVALELDRLDRTLRRFQLEALSLSAYDMALFYRRPEPAEPGTLVRDKDIVIVQITDRTLRALSEQGLTHGATIPRRLHAKLLDRLRELGARVVAFDMVFTPETPDDPVLEQAMRRMAGKVLVGARPVEELDYTGGGSAAHELRSYLHSVPDIRGVGQSGLVALPQDADQAIRRFQWYDVTLNDDAEEQKTPAFAPAACALYLGAAPLEAIREVDGGRFCGRPIRKFEGLRVTAPRVGQGQAPPTSLVDYLGGPSEGFRMFNYEDVLFSERLMAEGRRDFEHFRDRLVIVGDTSRISQDIHKTPYYSSTLRTSSRPGPEIQANVAHTILAGHYLGRASPEAEQWLLVLCAVGIALATRRLNPVFGFVATAGSMAALVVGGAYTLASLGFWFDPVRPSLAVGLAFAMEMVLLQVAERRQQHELRSVFGRLVDPAVVEEMVREDQPPQLGGEEREVTLLFSDLQAFTALCERLPPAHLVRLLNAYFERMLAVVFKHGGTLDKLMGDGIMAYWGAPKPRPDHAAAAVACALEMQEALEVFRREAAHLGEPPLFMRIGLHTGRAVVGLMGSRDREAYTLTGDVVNVAARLEVLNKELGTTILLSADTLSAAGDRWRAVDRGEHRVKGRHRAIRVFSVGPPQPSSPAAAHSGGSPAAEALISPSRTQEN